MAINFLTTTNTLPEIQINDTGNNPRLKLQESGSVSGGISTTGGALVFEVSSGVEKARILSTGQFLIGHTSYYYAGTYLQVGNTSDDQNGLQITTSTTGNGYILFGDGTGANSYIGQIRYNHSNNSMVFNTNGAVAMTINSTGKVGVGHDTLYQKFTVNGNIDIRGGNGSFLTFNNGDANIVINYNGGGRDLSFKTYDGSTNAERMRITKDGKVGIGTTSPSSFNSNARNLVVNSSGNTGISIATTDTNANSSLIFADGTGGTAGYRGAIRYKHNGDYMQFDTSASERMRITSAGNVGIGTTNPTYKLDVKGNAARIGSASQTTTTLYLTATNTAGAPAIATEVIMQGYEGRGIGTFYQDVTYSGEEWFAGMPYGGSFNNYQIGYDASGGQAEYTANAIITAYHDKSVYLDAYGSGTYTGTAATYLAVTSSGKIIETGSGGVLPGGPYLPLAGGTMTGNLRINDNLNLYIGNQTDLVLAHNGTTSYISNYTGDLIIENADDDNDIIFKCDNGAGGVSAYITLDGSNVRTRIDREMRFMDTIEATFGTGGDLKILHDSNHSYLKNYTGDFYIENFADNKDIIFKSDDGSGGVATYFKLDGSEADGTYTYTQWVDNGVITFGGSNDLRIWHDSSNSNGYIRNYTSNLMIENTQDDGDIRFNCDNGSGGTTEYFRLDGGVGYTIASKDIRFDNSVKARFGTGLDAYIQHDGTNTSLVNATGDLIIRCDSDDIKILAEDDVVIRDNNDSTEMAKFINGGAVELYYSGAKKLETTSGGIVISGAAYVNDYLIHSGDTDTKIGFNTNNNIELIAGGNVQISADINRSYLRYQGSAKLYTDTTGVYISGRTTILGTNTFFIESNSTAATFNLNSGTRGFQFINNNATLLSLASDGYATFASGIQATNTSFSGTMNIAGGIYHIGDTNTWFGFDQGNDTFRIVTGGGERLDVNNSGVRIGGNVRVTTILDEDNMASDSATALATQQSIKAYVDSSITGSTTYRGTWDPDVSLNSGYGNPNLNTVTKQDGYYYICSDNGSATPNGSGTEPNSWHTGDWVVYNSDLGSSGEWQKIDNTSVLSGTGTGQKVAKWDGSGTSETLADGPITFSSNDSTFTGYVRAPFFTTDAGRGFKQDSVAFVGTYSNGADANGANDIGKTANKWRDAYFSGQLNSATISTTSSATFGGDVTIPQFIKHTGDADTYFGFSASNQVIFHVGGGDRLIINSAGNVGIGTVSPSVKLEINGGADAIARITGTTTAARFDYKTNSHHMFWQLIESDGRFRLYDQTNTSERLTITSSGNVGIRTSSPTGVLDVLSTDAQRYARFRAPNGEERFEFHIGSTGNGARLSMFDHDGTTEGVRLSASGNSYLNNSSKLGINTSSPSRTLHVGGPGGSSGGIMISPTSGDAEIQFQDSGTTNAYITLDDGTHDLNFRDDSATVMTVDFASERVGIGTTSPSTKLHVYNGEATIASSTDGVKLSYSNGNSSGVIDTAFSDNALEFRTNGTAKMWIANGGNVGIGTTSPTYKLSVSGGIVAGGKVTYAKNYSSLDTTGNAVAGLTTGYNGNSAGFIFTCIGHTGGYQRIVYSCYNGSGTWYAKKVIDEGTNDFDIEASASGTSITFTFKSKSGTKYYSPRVLVEATGHSINNTYA